MICIIGQMVNKHPESIYDYESMMNDWESRNPDTYYFILSVENDLNLLYKYKKGFKFYY